MRAKSRPEFSNSAPRHTPLQKLGHTMQTFESGGVLVINPDRHKRALLAAFAFGAAAMVLPPILGIYLLVIA